MGLIKSSPLTKTSKKSIAHYSRASDLGSLSLGANGIFSIFDSERHNDSAKIVKLSATQIKLLAGRKYKLTADISVAHSANDYIYTSFYDVTNAVYIGSEGRHLSAQNASNLMNTSQAAAIITTVADTTIELRVKSVGSGTVSILYTGSNVIVEELEEVNIQASVVGVVESGKIGNILYKKYSDGTLWQGGWDYITGSAATTITKVITFAMQFYDNDYFVRVNSNGHKATTIPTHANDTTATNLSWASSYVGTLKQTFTAQLSAAANMSASNYYVISWEAWGRWR